MQYVCNSCGLYEVALLISVYRCDKFIMFAVMNQPLYWLVLTTSLATETPTGNTGIPHKRCVFVSSKNKEMYGSRVTFYKDLYGKTDTLKRILIG